MCQFKVEVIADNSGRWCGNQLVFDTHEEGEAYARDLANRWTLVREWRVVEAEGPGADGSARGEESSPPVHVGFTITLGPITRLYRALCTTAPVAYDAGTSITLVTGPAGTIEGLLSQDQLLSIDKDVPSRVVLVEASLFEWHRARYSSGAFASAEPDSALFGSSEIVAEVLHRLDRGTPSSI